MIRALHIAPCDFPTRQGSQVYIHARVAGLRAIGVDARVACYPGRNGEDSVPTVRPAGTTRVERSGPHPAKPWLDLRLAARVAAEVRAGRVDVLHAHNVEAPFVAAVARALGGRRPPIVYDLHTSLEAELPTYLSRGRRPAAWVGRLVDHAIPQICDHFVAISPNAADFLRARGARNVVPLPPPLDPSSIGEPDPARARATWDLDGRPWVAYTGNTDRYQDLPLLFAAMAQVPSAGLIVVTGDETAPLARSLREAGVPEHRVRLVRSGRFEDARDALAAARVAALPRTRCTGFPIKLLNHQALGLPTVASAGGATGLGGVDLVADGDVPAFARALHRLITDADAHARASADARQAVRAHAPLPVAEALREVYVRALAR